MRLRTSFCFLLVAVIACVGGTDVMATEEAKYTVIDRGGDFELRQYEPHIVAETLVVGDFETVGNEGFRRLYDYISGNNRKR